MHFLGKTFTNTLIQISTNSDNRATGNYESEPRQHVYGKHCCELTVSDDLEHGDNLIIPRMSLPDHVHVCMSRIATRYNI